MKLRSFQAAHPNFGMSLGPGFAEQMPDLMASVAACIALWADIDLQMGRLLGAILRVDDAAMAALYSELWNQRSNSKIFKAVAKERLTDGEIKLLNDLLAIKDNFADERHLLAHAIYGIVGNDVPGLVIVRSNTMLKYYTRFQAASKNDSMTVEAKKLLNELKKDALFASKDDLEEICQRFKSFHRIVYDFAACISTSPGPARDELCRSLVHRLRPFQ